MIRRPVLVAGACLVLLGAACSNDGPTSSAEGITLPPETLAFPAATPKARTTVPPVTAPPTTVEGAVTPASAASIAPDAPTTVAAPTTAVVLAICDVNVVVEDIGPADEGYTFADLRCSGPWATVVAKAFDPSISTDELIVLYAEEGQWIVVAGGGDTSCTTAGIPPDQFGDLGCDRWER